MELSEERIEESIRKIQEPFLKLFDDIAKQVINQHLEMMQWFDSETSKPREINKGRPKRNAFNNATNKINNQMKLPNKLRRPDSMCGEINIYDHMQQKKMKSEIRDSRPLMDSSNMGTATKEDTSVLIIDTPESLDVPESVIISDDENIMPPPKMPLKARKKPGRKAKSKNSSFLSIKKERSSSVRQSSRKKASTSTASTENTFKVTELQTVVSEDSEADNDIKNRTIQNATKDEVPPKITLAASAPDDTVESIYEDAVASVAAPVAETQNMAVLNLTNVDKPVIISKTLENDAKILNAVIKLTKIDHMMTENVTETNVNDEPETVNENLSDQTFVKQVFNPDVTHVIKTEVATPDKRVNDQTVVITPSKRIHNAGLDTTVVVDNNKQNIANETFNIGSKDSRLPNADLEIENVDKDLDKTSHKTPENVSIPEVEDVNEINSDSLLITDDDTEPEEEIYTKKPTLVDNVLFSSQSPVKCRVKAFEEAIVSQQQPPMRVTRTKTRAMNKEQTSTDREQNCTENIPNTNVSKLPTSVIKNRTKKMTPLTLPRKLKAFTPLQKSNSKTNLSANTFASRNIATGIETFITKTNPTTKAINREEEHKKQQAKEEEARRKKEQMLLDKQEEHKRKRMEKERMVQQARELQEKEKLMQIEKIALEKEKKRKFLQEREEKMKEEMRLKKLLSQQKAAESEKRRKMEEQARLQKLQEQEEEQKRIEMQQKKEEEDAERLRVLRQAQDAELERKRQAYAEHKAKQLKLKELQKQKALEQNKTKKNMPEVAMTGGFEYLGSDCSTDDEEGPPKFPRPEWASVHRRGKSIAKQSSLPSTILDYFYMIQPTTPDLQEIFPGIEKEKLQRKSSAVWRTPPRYSQLQKY